MTTFESTPAGLPVRPTLFLFAHQDDEIAVLPEIERLLAAAVPFDCVYLTSGNYGGQSAERRMAESRAALGSLGVSPERLHFLGTELGIGDGALVESLDRVHAGLLEHLPRLVRFQRVIVHAFEGGHQDHDAAHLIGLAIAQRAGVLAESLQYPLYRAAPAPLPYLLYAPLDRNGPVLRLPTTPVQRLRHLGCLLSYRSQAKTLVALLPFLLLHQMTNGAVVFQPVRLERAEERPHAGPLLYERRKRYGYERFYDQSRSFVARHVLGPS